MKSLRTFALGIVAALALLVAQASDLVAGERYGKQKVVYHINYNGGDDDKRYRGAMRNIQNHINAVGAENMEIKVVLHGNGLGLLMSAKENSKVKGAVVSLKSQNVGFQVCNNTLKGRKISYENDLFDVYEGDKLPEGKKSYALSFLLQDDASTLKDAQIDKVMKKLQDSFRNKHRAELR